MSVGLWVWWVFRCNAMLCGWFAVGLIKEELVEEGREEMADHRERESLWVSGLLRFFVVVVFFFFFLNIVLI